jgi:hypothetical protein
MPAQIARAKRFRAGAAAMRLPFPIPFQAWRRDAHPAFLNHAQGG